MKTDTHGQPRSRRLTTVRKVLLASVVCVLIVAVCFAGYSVISLYTSLRSINPGAGSGKSSLNLHERINILVMGVDSRAKDDPGRSDSIMLIGLDPVSRTVSVLSIPRDSHVNIPGHGFDKINAATNPDYFSDGGVQLLEKTVESMIPGIKINYYTKADFQGFVQVIDALGGVTINVEKAMYYKAVDTLIDLKPGVQHMDGKTALEYARFRHDAIGDFGSWGGQEYGRVVRQKALLKAIVAQTTSIRNVWKLPPVIRAVEGAVVTDLLPNDLLRIALTFKSTTDQDVTTVAFPGVPGNIAGTSYVIPDLQALQSNVAPLFSPTLPAS
jgi:polyisoprenyl-teichoic acid--peptidoglycan teichoic acid transferase